MKIAHLENTVPPFVSETGEQIDELIGKPEALGASHYQSIACSIMAPDKHSAPHFHKIHEETLYILEGQGQLEVNDEVFTVATGDTCFLQAGEVHALRNTSTDIALKLLAITSPPWDPSDSCSVKQGGANAATRRQD